MLSFTPHCNCAHVGAQGRDIASRFMSTYYTVWQDGPEKMRKLYREGSCFSVYDEASGKPAVQSTGVQVDTGGIREEKGGGGGGGRAV